MDPSDIITILTGVSGVAGGFFGGKKLGSAQAQQIAVDTVELLQVGVAELERQGREKSEELVDLRARVRILEDLITQRAEVEAVHEDVKSVMHTVDFIKGKVAQ